MPLYGPNGEFDLLAWGRAGQRMRRKMRLIPVITAILVTLGLYLAVFERESLLAFARAQGADEAKNKRLLGL